MKKPFILLTTNDQEFETAALRAIRETGHRSLRARDIHDTWRNFTTEPKRIAAAVIDLDVDEHGMSFLRLLARSKPHFAVLAVTRNVSAVFETDVISGIVFDYMFKPVAVEELQQTILELCRESDFNEESALFQ